MPMLAVTESASSLIMIGAFTAVCSRMARRVDGCAVRHQRSDDDEFIAAHARYQVLHRDRGPQPFRDHLQELVAAGVSARVVDVLEVVDVHVHERQQALSVCDLFQHLWQSSVQIEPVRQARQRVVLGQLQQLAAIRALLRDCFRAMSDVVADQREQPPARSLIVVMETSESIHTPLPRRSRV